MKRVQYLIICCLLVLGCAQAEGFIHVSTNAVIWHDQVSTANFNAFCKRTKTFMAQQSLYMADTRKYKQTAYYYACDATGQRKVTVSIARNQYQKMEVSMNVSIEGDMTESVARDMLQELMGKTQQKLSERF